MNLKIPKNRDQGVDKNRIAVLGSNLLNSIQELKSRSDKPTFIVSSIGLYNVPGVVKDSLNVEPAVTARLEGIEKMVENLAKSFKEMQVNKNNSWPQLQVMNPQGVPQGQAETARKSNTLSANASTLRGRSPSTKRSLETEEQENGRADPPKEDQPWTDIVKKNQGRKPRPPRPHQVGTSKVDVAVAGGEAAPYNIVIGNTHPDSTPEIITAVLKKVSEQVSPDIKPLQPLEVLDIECLTKPREDGRRIWSKSWRVQVSNKLKEYMEKAEAYPAGWTCRKYFPPRPARPPTPQLDPTAEQPPRKKSHREEPPYPLN